MGMYINPENGTKEEWLAKNAAVAGPSAPIWEELPDGHLPVCLVDNGPFRAAEIAYSKEELMAFNLSDDHRPKVWFIVKKEKLEPFMK